MKKRHQQKLVILSIGLVIFLNLPIIFIFNNDIDILGIPLLYAYIFFVWLLSVIITFTVLKKYG
ncbi:hypothetical protein JCM19298_1011 [Nonlabens ulvanivorans]|nr:hypothetical protein [Nonlabens ulvanivorans]GAK89972.1 hypothetical protein JCM19297_594 [Nonlabens ulvanivorans]GAK93674.1 hypothetical protein JCM19298_1011 [Nonlabens ulvanivorans]